MGYIIYYLSDLISGEMYNVPHKLIATSILVYYAVTLSA